MKNFAATNNPVLHKLLKAAIVGTGVMAFAATQASTLIFTNGYVTGIEGLVVHDKIYDVSIKGGSYNDVFGSDTPTFIGDYAGASAAANAMVTLLNAQKPQPLTSDFLYQGLPNGIIWTPYQIDGGGSNIRTTQVSIDGALGMPDWHRAGDLVGNNPSTANWTPIWNWRYAVYTYEGNVAAVPEPETYAMLLTGLMLVGLAKRRKQSQSIEAAQRLTVD